MSSSLTDQLKDILDVVARGLSRGNASQRVRREKAARQAERKAEKAKEEEAIRSRIERGLWHDGRVDAVCGNGVMSELGVGIEPFRDSEADPLPSVPSGNSAEGEKGEQERKAEDTNDVENLKQKQKRSEDIQTIETMPVVIIKNFESKGGGARKEELLNVLATWAASIAENQVSQFV